MHPDQSILEGIMTTINGDGGVNIAPMGPIVDADMTTLRLRPYQTSMTYQNLKRTGQGVFHVTDDVLLLAQAAVGQIDPMPTMSECTAVSGYVLTDTCRWYALEVNSIDDSQPRTEIFARVVEHGRLRDFFGFNRAKHAVVEAAILATRIEFLPPESILQQFGELAVPVEKTGSRREHEAFETLRRYVRAALATKTD